MHPEISLITITLVFIAAKALNWLSYKRMKARILERQTWDLNICCGKTDGGGLNADIFQHTELPNFILISDIYHLPFRNKQFNHVLCSHTMEHVEDPDLFFKELQRVGNHVTIVIPPLWDFAAALNLFEHRWLFFSLKTEHRSLPPRVHLKLADFLKDKLKIVFIKA